MNPIIPPLTGARNFAFFGDSITQGQADPALNGFRLPLFQQFATDKAAGVYPSSLTLTSLGSVVGGDPPTDHCEGHAGYTAGDLLAFIPTYYGPGKTVTSLDIAWVLIGINNATTDAGYEAFFTDYPNLITTIKSLTGCNRFFVSLIRPVAGVQLAHAISINAQLPTMWNALQAADPNLILVRGSENIDGFPLHPSAAQFAALSALWHAPFRELLGYPL